MILDLEVEFGHEDQPYIQSNRYQYELLLRKVRPRHFVGTPKLEYSYNV